MKKSKLIILFILGVLLWGFIWQIGHEWNSLRQPIIQEGKINIDGLISSIKQVINPNELWLNNQNYERFDTIHSVLQYSYYDTEKIDTGAMITNALKAYVDALDDPYTIYMDTEQNSGFQEELKWSSDFEGVGAVISKKDYYIQIDEVIKWWPAFNAWCMMLDRIVMINTWLTKDIDVYEAVDQIRWPKWSTVTLTIERIAKDGTKEIIEKDLIRDTINVPSVNGKVLSGNIGYINISLIGEETENLLKTTIIELKKNQIKWIILDLRGNGGWILPIAVEIASHFIPQGKTIVSAKYSTFEDEIMKSQWYSDLQDIPVVVLIDGLTASAWEIIALALQQNIGAQLIGTTSFGKWSIQTMTDFDDGASLKYTVWKWYAPNGIHIDKTGITPDIIIEFDWDSYLENDRDNQLEKAEEVIKTLLQ